MRQVHSRKMTPRQRILNAIRRQPTDRLVVAPFVFLNFVRKFFNDPQVDVVAKTIEVYQHFGFDIIHRNARPGYSHIPASNQNWEVKVTKVNGNNCCQETTEIHTPGGILKQVTQVEERDPFERNMAYLGNVTEYLLKSRQDFAIFKEYAPPQNKIDVSEVRRARNLVAELGIIAPWVQGAFNFVNLFRSMEELFSDPLLDPGFYTGLMTYFMDRNTEIIRQYVQAGATVLSYGGNVANGRSVGPKFFREFVLPFEKELVRRIHDMGAMVIYHNCGYAANLYKAYSELDIDVFETLTEAPFGDGDIAEAMAAFEQKSALSGNLDQVNFLLSASSEEIYKRTASLVNKIRPYKHFIVAASDFLETNTPHENVHAFAHAAKDHGEL